MDAFGSIVGTVLWIAVLCTSVFIAGVPGFTVGHILGGKYPDRALHIPAIFRPLPVRFITWGLFGTLSAFGLVFLLGGTLQHRPLMLAPVMFLLALCNWGSGAVGWWRAAREVLRTSEGVANTPVTDPRYQVLPPKPRWNAEDYEGEYLPAVPADDDDNGDEEWPLYR